MPDWLDFTSIANTSLATGIIIFLMRGIVKVFRFFGPKVTAVAEGHVAVMKDLGDASIRQTALMERTTGMLNDHSTTLNVHGQILNVHSEQLRNIAESVGATVVRKMPQSSATVTMQPGVEVSADGQTRPVVVATEVIHQEQGK